MDLNVLVVEEDLTCRESLVNIIKSISPDTTVKEVNYLDDAANIMSEERFDIIFLEMILRQRGSSNHVSAPEFIARIYGEKKEESPKMWLEDIYPEGDKALQEASQKNSEASYLIYADSFDNDLLCDMVRDLSSRHPNVSLYREKVYQRNYIEIRKTLKIAREYKEIPYGTHKEKWKFLRLIEDLDKLRKRIKTSDSFLESQYLAAEMKEMNFGSYYLLAKVSYPRKLRNLCRFVGLTELAIGAYLTYDFIVDPASYKPAWVPALAGIDGMMATVQGAVLPAYAQVFKYGSRIMKHSFGLMKRIQDYIRRKSINS